MSKPRRRTGAALLLETAFLFRFPEAYELPNEAEVAVRLVLQRLSLRTEKVLRMRFGIDCMEHYQREVAARIYNLHSGKLGVSVGRVASIEWVGLRDIRSRHGRMLSPDIEAAFR